MVRSNECMGGMHAHHGLDALEVDNIIRIAVIDDGAHTSVDDFLEIRERSTHPIASRSKIIIDVNVDFLPYSVGANFGCHRLAA